LVINSQCIELPEDVDMIISQSIELSSIHKTLTNDFDRLFKIIDSLLKVDDQSIMIPDEINGILDESLAISEKYNDDRKLVGLINELLININKVDSEIDLINRKILVSGTEREVLLEQLTICPSCGVELTKDSKKVLLGEHKC
jgi:hypothetical protein